MSKTLSYLALAFLALIFITPSGSARAETETATFAGGCFWCMDAEFRHLPGVENVVSGYTGGHIANPTYEQVSSGTTGHFESVNITFNPAKITYEKLLDIFWHNVDPTDPDGQFCDKGSQYHAGIFTHGETQKKLAEDSREKVKKLFAGNEVATIIEPAQEFYPAEEYHQDYHSKNKVRYALYHSGCGRDKRLGHIWSKPSTAPQ